MAKLALLAEDEAIIALMAEDALAESGFAVAGPFSHCAKALTWLTGNTPDVALLDVELRDGPCIEVARILSARGVPLVFFSGGPFRIDIRAEFPDALVFEKPTDYAAVMRVLHGLIDGR